MRVLVIAVGLVALVGFAVVLARLTLTPSAASADIAGANLRPGHSLRQYAEEYTFLAACKQIGGNLALGAPFGLILPVLVPRRLRMVRVMLLTTVVIVFVELAQGALVEGRAFDVDDVLLNTGGALIAYLMLGRRIGHRFHTLGEPKDGASVPGPVPQAGTAGTGDTAGAAAAPVATVVGGRAGESKGGKGSSGDGKDGKGGRWWRVRPGRRRVPRRP
ncbi:VanZ family protein [Streptomyces sp. NPDC020965]|uniref:VanZ family protein n=1 Tax=Streptomyces sp. NPDC020965 TaxID=3365105 RepID=UPI0037A59F54